MVDNLSVLCPKLFELAHAPVTKGLIILYSSLSLFLSLSSFSTFLDFPSIHYIVPKLHLWRPITSLLFFSRFWIFLMAIVILYQCRLVERRLGSAKFAGFLIYSTIVGLFLQIITMSYLSCSIASEGPLGLVMGCAALYISIIPGTTRWCCGMFSNKVSFVFLCAQLLYFQGSLCGVVIGLGEFVAGVCYNRNSFSLQQFRVPIRIQKFVQVNVAPMLQMDVFPFNTHPTGNPQVGRNADLEAGFSRGSQIGPVSEENIATLCSLGFSREQALMALLQTGDNLPFASNLLFDGY